MTERTPLSRIRKLLIVVVLSAGTLIGCSGEEGARAPSRGDPTPPAHSITPKAIKRCLTNSGIEASNKVDPVADEAGVGAVAAAVGSNRVNIAVERTAAEARSTIRAYERVPARLRMRLEQTGPVVAAYTKTPTTREKRAISGCVEGT